MLESPIRPAMRSPLQQAFDRIGSAPAVWTPADLFATGDQGGAWDMSSASAIFQLSNGTTAVNEGDPVGYVSDSGLVAKPALQATAGNRPRFSGMPRTLGTEIASNGRFASDTVWTKGAGWTITGGRAEKSAGTASVLSQSVTVTENKHYQITYNITHTAGTVVARFTGGTTVLGASRSASGSYIDVLIAEAGNTTLEFSADAAFAGSVDNCSIKEVSSFTNRGAWYDGSNDMLQTAAIDLSGSDKATLLISGYYDQQNASRTLFEFANYYGNTPGSFSGLFDTKPQLRVRGSTTQVTVAMPNNEGAVSGVGMAHANIFEVDLAGAATLDEAFLTARGVQPTRSVTGADAGAGNMANGVLTFGSATNSFLYWRGLQHRAILINRLLTPNEKQAAMRWVMAGMAYCAVIGDSTVAVNTPGGGLPNAVYVSSLVGGMVTGAADVSVAGHNIAQQLAAWTALPLKTALQAVFVQIGLNDVRGRVGAGTATTAQVIADYQALINTINADKPAGCKVYVSQMTPCKVWLDGAVNPAAAYAAWQDLNTAIAGGGSTPITGVDGRITSHVAALNDGAGNLNAIYDHSADGVHESNEARFIVAQAWRTQLEADGLV